MTATLLMAAPILLSAVSIGWVDPAGDTFPGVSPPALDLIALEVSLQPAQVVITIRFDPNSTSEADLYVLEGFIDLDTDSNSATGRPSHFDEFGAGPSVDIGVDEYVAIYPEAGLAELTHVANGIETSAGFFPTVQEGLTVSITLPRCQQNPQEGICISEPYRAVGLIGNESDFTDRIPNGTIPLAHRDGDFDGDGDVDDADVSHLRLCRSGPGLAVAIGCNDADLDYDGDVDQDDFGILQRNYTGSGE